MAERLHRTAGLSDFDIEAGERSQIRRAGGYGESAMEEQARKIGRILGRAVVTVREARETVKDIGGETCEVAAIRMTNLKDSARRAGERIGAIAEEAAAEVSRKATQWREAATGAASDLGRATFDKVDEVRARVKTGYFRLRLQANRVVREHPVELLLVGGTVGFLLGAGMRIWRSNREP